jgi:hypothetical protein
MNRMQRMTTYTLSHLMNAWHIHRHGEDISIAAQDLLNAEEALRLALKLAEADRPSKVLRIERTGDNEVIAVFE